MTKFHFRSFFNKVIYFQIKRILKPIERSIDVVWDFDCKYFRLPKTRTDWWKNKIENTVIKDKLNEDKLKSNGWNVITIWECELKAKKRKNTLNLLKEKLKNNIIKNH